MLAVPTAVLLHTFDAGDAGDERAPGGEDHYDWLVGDPDRWPAAEARLWTARVALPPWQWADEPQLALTPLPPHRARYLRYEGPISGGRGRVRRVDAGYAVALDWRADRAVLMVWMTHFAGRVALRRVDDERWTARVLRVFPRTCPPPTPLLRPD